MKTCNYKKTLALLLIGFSTMTSVQAKVTLPAFMGDNMVLQQKEKVKFWGTSSFPNKNVKVKTNWNNKSYEAHINAQGQWELYLETPKYGGPYQITIDDGDLLTLNNILIGEVWFCSGQSNMEMPLAGWGQIKNYQQEIKSANYPNIRILQIPKSTANRPTSETQVDAGGWNVVTPEHIAEFSATAYFFAREIFEKTGIPVGLIHSSWGGTIIESWMSAEALSPFDQYKATLEKMQQKDADAFFAKEMAAWQEVADREDKGKSGGWLAKNLDVSSWHNITIPSFYDKVLFPGMDGVVYFRKEVKLPKHWVGKNINLILGAVDDNDITYVNGQYVGQTDGYNQIRNYSVSSAINDEATLSIAVRVFDGGGEGGIYGGTEQPRLEGPNGETLSLSGEWKCNVGFDIKQLPPMPAQLSGPNRPSVLYNAMVQPFVDFKIKGAIWYQGESNTDHIEAPYVALFPALIKDWRNQWHNEKMPFYFVQLANFKEKVSQPQASAWANLRDAQRTTLEIPHTGMAVIADVGEASDIHPKNKQEVGRRLALIALHQDYNKKISYSGPELKNWTVKGREIQLNFNPMGQKLILKDLHKSGGGFVIAGEDHVFYPAEVRQEGNKIIISAQEVVAPVAVRYGWADNPDLVLFNDAGLPASPFRTDNWHLAN